MLRARHGHSSDSKLACAYAAHVLCVGFSRWYAQFLLYESILYAFPRWHPVEPCPVLRAAGIAEFVA
jgi:hypothetical protein